MLEFEVRCERAAKNQKRDVAAALERSGYRMSSPRKSIMHGNVGQIAGGEDQSISR